MTAFTSFMDQLPDPNYKINAAGASDSSGNAGPGFAKIKFGSNNQIQVSRTISGRGVTASPGYHMWEFSINYNPMTRTEFDPVASFLEQRRGRLYPFYVVLPQHAAPQNSSFVTHLSTNTIKSGWNFTTTAASGTGTVATLTFTHTPTLTVSPFKVGDTITVSGVTPTAYNGTFTVTAVPSANQVSYSSTATGAQTVAGKVTLTTLPAGSSYIPISSYLTSTGAVSTISGTPTPGDFFTITDANDANHKKAYKVVRVESNATYLTGLNQPAVSEMRIYTVPPLSRATSADSTLNFINPRFRVIQKSDTIEYDLDTDNLYQFSVNLEEILP